MPKSRWLRGLIVPVSILSILFVAFVAYYMYWVPSRQRLLDDRGFRYLKTLSEQIRLTVNTYDKMMDNAVQSGILGKTMWVTRKNLDRFLNNVAPQLVLVDIAEANQVVGDKSYEDPPKIAIKADEGTHFLYFAFSHEFEGQGVKEETLKFAVRADFDRLINGLLGPSNLTPFDVVLIAQSDGRVIFQKSLSGIEVSEIKNLEDASGVVAKDKEKKQIDIAWLSPASRQEEVWIAGARYRLYSQPLQVGFLRAKNSSDTPESWVLCGLVRADRFRSESQLIPYAYILVMLAAILLAAASYPFLKLYLSCPGERLRARDVTLVAVFACFVAALLTLILVDVYFWKSSFGPAAERDMARLALAMNRNFQFEQKAALSVLNALNETNEIKDPLKQSGDHSNITKHVCYYEDDEKGSKCTGAAACNPEWACRVNVLTDKPISSKLAAYPYPFFAFWSDSTGKQQIKWTTRLRPTPFISLDDSSVPFYPELRRALKKQPDSQTEPPTGIGSQYSSTTGQNITTFWEVNLRPRDENGKPYEGEEATARRYSYALVVQPISLYNAVLPGGYQFAVLTPEGTVVFHSDTTRNLRENFFAETGQNPDLRSRVRMRSEGPVTANYIGRPHRMYVLPMAAGNQDGLWTIVIFRDLHIEEVLNLEILSLVTILFFLYAAAITLVIIAVHWMRRGRAKAWFWPDSRRAQQYRRITITNLFAVILLLLLSRFVPASALLLCAALIPAAGLVSAIVMIGRPDDSQVPPLDEDRAASNSWTLDYFQAAATLVLLIAVLPCLCFFKLAADFGQQLLVKHTLLNLAGDLDKRALVMQILYQDVKLGGFQSQILAGPDQQDARPLLDEEAHPAPPSVPVFSYHRLLNETDVVSDVQPPHGSASANDESSLLSALTYPYNESAADDRYLAEGKSDVWKWTSSRSERGRELALTRSAPGGPARTITAVWQPFHYPWSHWVWWLGVAVFLAAIYWLVRLSFTRIFLLDLVVPPLAKSADPELDPATLMADLPMNLLLIGPVTNHQIDGLLHRPDVQIREAEDLLLAAQSNPANATGATPPAADAIDAVLRDGRALLLRNFERLSDKDETAAKAHAALTRVLSALGNSVVIVSSLDPVLMSSIEASERWRMLLRSFVRIDLHSTPRQRKDEDDADYQSRISAGSYFHWLFAGLPRNEKLIMLQLAKEEVVNPNSSEIVYELLEQGLVERKHGLLTVTDPGFKHFLPHALPHHTVKLWEKEMAGARPFSLQTSLLILGVGVVAFLVYTQGDVFNTWVTYATGVAAAVPKALQFFENLQSKSAATS